MRKVIAEPKKPRIVKGDVSTSIGDGTDESRMEGLQLICKLSKYVSRIN